MSEALTPRGDTGVQLPTYPQADVVGPFSRDEPWYLKATDIGALPLTSTAHALYNMFDLPRHALESPAPMLDPEIRRQTTEAVLTAGMLGASGEGLPSFPGWHGSRHVFDPEPAAAAPFGQFRETAIGSGEGAQAFGWGHYIAGERQTAEQYKTAGASSWQLHPTVTLDGSPVDTSHIWTSMKYTPVEAYGLHQFEFANGNVDAAARALRKQADATDHIVQNFDYLDKHKNSADPKLYAGLDRDHDIQEAGYMRNAADWLEKNSHRLDMQGAGNMYQVWIRPEKKEFLDWDKRWDEQSPEVQKAIRNYFPKLAEGADKYPESTGEDLYYKQQDWMLPSKGKDTDQLTSEAMDQAGIPGLKFLDAGSRHLPKTVYLEGKPWVLGSDAERVAEAAIARGSVPPHKMNTSHLRDNANEAWNNLSGDVDFGNFTHAKSALGHGLRDEEYERVTNDAMNWLNRNQDKLSMGDHPDATHNYVVFHHRHVNIIDRNGRLFGLEPTDVNPFTGEPIP